MKRHLAVTALLLVVAGLAAAADVAGTWKGAFTHNDQPMPLTFVLKGGTNVTGTITGLPSGVTEIKDGKLDGDQLSFWCMVEYQGNPVKLVYRGKITGNEIQFEFGTEDGSWVTQFVAKKS
jgi:hypothetical protein